MDLFSIGARVRLLNSDEPLSGVVVSISIGSGMGVSYNVAYWQGGVRETVWVEAFEIGLDCESTPMISTASFVHHERGTAPQVD